MLTRPVFRSVAALAGQRRNGFEKRASDKRNIERSGFVFAALGSQRVAVPVEQVERVLRSFSTSPAILYADRQMPFADLTRPLGVRLAVTERARRRILIVCDGVRRWAVPVDSVYDVAMVDTMLVFPLKSDDPALRLGVLGRFEHRAESVIVVDAVRILAETALARAR